MAAYLLCAGLLPDGKVLDLGCGIGHSYGHLRGQSFGLDLDHASLLRQERPTIRADMRRIPLREGAVACVLSVQSLEHVRDPNTVVFEAARVVGPEGTAVFVTPNRLTFGRPDEIIDPWHFVEFDAHQLRELCGTFFREVKILGLHGDDRYLMVRGREMIGLNRVLRADFLRLRRLAPRWVRRRIYSRFQRRMRGNSDSLTGAISAEDFRLRDDSLDTCLDLVAICRRPCPAE